MNDFESFSSYQLTHEKGGNRTSSSGGGCMSGCATIVVAGLLIVAFITILFIV